MTSALFAYVPVQSDRLPTHVAVCQQCPASDPYVVHHTHAQVALDAVAGHAAREHKQLRVVAS